MSIGSNELIIILVIMLIYVAAPALLIVMTFLFYRRLKEFEERLYSLEEKLAGTSRMESSES
ncbi:MAG: hypothetical protein P8Z00_02230 [Anaerolineales bacterium]